MKFKGIPTKELEKAYMKSLEWFFAFPMAKIGLTELTRNIHTSKTATKEAVEKLIEQNFITREVIGKAWLLSTNQKNRDFSNKKISSNLNNIYESNIIKEINKVYPQAKVIILFGSYRWGDDHEKSDIDIAIEILGSKMEIINLGIIEQLGYRKNIPVNLHLFSRSKIDINLFSNIANGIVLDGFLEVKP